MRPVLIQDLTLLAGRELQNIESANLLVRKGKIIQVNVDESKLKRIDILNGRGLIAIPGLINAHTHIGDSFAKDVGVGLTLKELVHPHDGIKAKLLSNTSPATMQRAITGAARDMLMSGITTFADFRENGVKGIALAKRALSGSKQRALLLGRPSQVQSDEEVAQNTQLPNAVLKEAGKSLASCDGFGISGANEYSDKSLVQLSRIDQTGKLMAIHAAESIDSVNFSNSTFHATEIERIFKHLHPNFIVHVTHPTERDIDQIVEKKTGVVCCPRANATLGVGFPPITKFLKRKVKVALGTDNVMLNSPDMFRELDYTAKMIKAITQDPSAVTSTQILRMATSDAADVLGIGSITGSLESGKHADIVFIDLNSLNLSSSKDIVSSIVHRARPDNIKSVMINGEIVYGTIKKA